MTKSNSDVKSIQKKLVAAVAMVLVACVMVVSSSYAWFTLSTAPEVTGITTSVGSNGNLEMALRTGALSAITPTTSGGSFPSANAYWGNLVDLSDGSYNLDKIALRPARLNAALVDGTGKEVDGVYYPAEYEFATGGYLKTPVYGADGRVSALEANTVNGIYNPNNNAFAEDATNSIFGVRAVGTTSNISPEALALRNAKQVVSAAISTSKSGATISLRDDSVKLANIFVTNVLDSSATFGAAEKTDIQNAINNLNAVVADLDNALKQAIVAVGVAQSKNFTTDKITLSSTDITVDGVTLDWTGLDTQKADLLTAAATLVAMQGELDDAQDALDAITADSGISFTDISAPLTKLLSTGDFKIIDSATGTAYTVTEMKDLAAFDAAKILLAKPTISIVNGIYHDIAEFSGNYSATTSMVVSGSYGSITLDNEKVTVIMATAATEPSVNGFHLNYIINWLSGLTITGGGTSANLLTDIYGYAIDLAFRTNANGSSLLLQTEAANRVNDSAVTQGAGSYMQFKSGNADFTLDQVKSLMESIRVVFMNDDGEIYGVAILDMANATDDGTFVKAPMVLANFNVGADGVLTLNGQKSDSVITGLPQNTAIGVTALVYLDGDTVENADVAINGDSMTGTMNLQFASDATLTPMDYTFAELQKLAAPTISLAGNDLTVDAVENATGYDIYVGSIKVGSLTQAGVYVLPDAATADVPAGTYNVTVVATADGYAKSDASSAVEYTIA